MVTKKSEYQRQFKVSAFKKNLPAYYENLVFRNLCRDREFAHTPIEWESSDESEGSSENAKCPSRKDSSTQTKKCKTKIPSKCVKHKKQKKIYILEESDDDNDYYDDDDCEEPAKVNKSTNTDCVLTEAEDSCSSSEDEDDDDNVVVLVKRKKNKHCEHKRKVPNTKTYTMKCTRIKRPDRCQEIPKKSCRKKRPVSAPVSERPPFVNYGWAENVKYRTHNVRAPRDIYTTALNALNAKRMRQLCKQEEADERLDCHKRQLSALFDKHHALQRRGSPADWQTEYQRCFTLYDAINYDKVLSARSRSGRSGSGPTKK